MKFGKQLELNANPEWHEYYIQYKKLKRIIKRVVFEIEKSSAKRRSSSSSAAAIEATPLLPSSSSLEQPPANEFWDCVNENLQTVNHFVAGRTLVIAAAVKKIENASASTLQDTVNFSTLQKLYDELVDLKQFIQLNHDGFRKIVKKFDKSTGSSTLSSFVTRLDHEPFATTDYDAVSTTLVDRVCAVSSRDKLEAGNMERRLLRNTSSDNDPNSICRKVKLIPFTISVALFAFVLNVPFYPEDDTDDEYSARERKCLGLLLFTTSLWVTEALPYFATALLVPPVVVFLRILSDPVTGDILSSEAAGKFVLSRLVNHTSVLIMGGYTISAAFSKCQIEIYIAAYLQSKFKNHPRRFLLAMMLMGLFLSCWISNHSAPVLCITVLLPILRDLEPDFVKTLLIGLAFACNLGGMMTPIASLQNTLAVSYLESAGVSISFGQWMAIAVPFCTVTTVICWVFLTRVMLDSNHQIINRYGDSPNHQKKKPFVIPQIVYDHRRVVNRTDVFVVVATLATIALWATFTLNVSTFGDLGIISLVFMTLMFGTGVLNQFDFNSFSWHILFLIGGGNVLGDAVQQSGLLSTLSTFCFTYLPTSNIWITTMLLCLLTLCLTTFVSHTVASIIFLPIIVQLSIQIGHPHIPVISCALSISAAMALPFSSFPNINSLLVLDDHGKPYLSVSDFLKVGVYFSVMTVLLITTLGFGLIVAVIGFKH